MSIAAVYLVSIVFVLNASNPTLAFEIEMSVQYPANPALGRFSGKSKVSKGRGWIKGDNVRSQMGEIIDLYVDGNRYSFFRGKWRKATQATFDLRAGAVATIPIVKPNQNWKRLREETVNKEKCIVYEKKGKMGTTTVWKRTSDGIVVMMKSQSARPPTGIGGTTTVKFKNFKVDTKLPRGVFGVPKEIQS